MVPQKHTESGVRSETLTVPELEQSKAAGLNTLASVHSRRSYAFAIDRFIGWYCSEPRLTFNRAVVVRYKSHLESLRLSASTEKMPERASTKRGYLIWVNNYILPRWGQIPSLQKAGPTFA
jgi:hypothetical protein